MKRMMQRQGQVEADGSSAAPRPAVSRPARPAPAELSAGGRVIEFSREVRSELRQVAWPTRPEVVTSTTVVAVTLIVLVALIFGLNYLFSHAVSFLFKT
jgi:preprotein translocase subunit SecE